MTICKKESQKEISEAKKESQKAEKLNENNSPSLNRKEEKEHSPTPTLTKTGEIINEISVLSLKSIKLKLDIEKTKKNQKKVDINNLPKEDFSQEELVIAWEDYTSKILEKGQKIQASILNVTDPILSKNYVINVTVPASTMKTEIKEQQHDLLGFLHERFNNYHITLKIRVSENYAKKGYYTPEEKYEYLNKTNPLLEQLRKDLGLEL